MRLPLLEDVGWAIIDYQGFRPAGRALDAFVVLSWLHTGFLRRHFSGVPTGDRLITCLISVDRRHRPGHALMEIPDSPPRPPLCWPASSPRHGLQRYGRFEATGAEVDFRGWEPSFVLIDSDVLAFLEYTSNDPNGAVWSVVDVGVELHVDVLTLRRRANPSVVHLRHAARRRDG